MKLLIDTDILIDVALNREAFVQDSAAVLDYLEKKPGQGFVAWHSIANFYYLVMPKFGKTETRVFLNELLRFILISPTTTKDLHYALTLNLSDFEDAMQVAAAVACGADRIVTRNFRHYKMSPIPAQTPEKLLVSFHSTS